MLINIGEKYMVVFLQPDSADPNGYQSIRLRFFGGSGNGGDYDYDLNEMERGNRSILIGRGPECNVKLNDKLLSKVQCHVRAEVADEQQQGRGNMQWILYDGF